MALPTFVTSADIAAWTGETISAAADIARANLNGAAASTLVRALTGSAWVDDAGALLWAAPGSDYRLQLLGDTLTTVAKTAAARAYVNPEGYKQEAEGPFSHAWDEGEGVYLTEKEERAVLAAVAQYRGVVAGLWTLPITRGTPYPTDIYVDVAGQDEPLPIYEPGGGL